MRELDQQLINAISQANFIAYLTVDESMRIAQVSPNLRSFFLPMPIDVRGMYLTEIFDEFVGSEHVLERIALGQETVYRLEYVSRSDQNMAQRYYTVEVVACTPKTSESCLLVLVIDTTVAGRLQQRLTQERNDLANAMYWRERAQRTLQQARDELELRVAERTSELAQTNEVLRREMEERRRIENELLQAQKMEAVGQLAGGVAHDFNNLLTIIISYSDLLLKHYQDDERVTKYSGFIRDAGSQAESLTRQLLTFGRKQVIQPRLVNVNEAVSEIVPMIRRLIGTHIQVVTALDDDLGLVEIDPAQFKQIVINLAVNARDAMPDGGQLLITTSNVPFEQFPFQQADQQTFTHGAVTLSVSDTGFGMDEEVKPRIFEPFFTTKDIGKGTGLGLSTVYGVVTQSGGHIHVDSELGVGSKLTVFLPRVNGSAWREGVDSRETAASDGAATILVVDDEEAIVSLVHESLNNSGYRVFTATSGEEAVSTMRKNELKVDLLLTDVLMNGMNGRELAQLLHTEHEQMRTLFMTGHNDTILTQESVLPDDIQLIEKPFTPDMLLRRVSKILD